MSGLCGVLKVKNVGFGTSSVKSTLSREVRSLFFLPSIYFLWDNWTSHTWIRSPSVHAYSMSCLKNFWITPTTNSHYTAHSVCTLITYFYLILKVGYLRLDAIEWKQKPRLFPFAVSDSKMNMNLKKMADEITAFKIPLSTQDLNHLSPLKIWHHNKRNKWEKAVAKKVS